MRHATTTKTRRRRTRTHSPWNIYSFFHRRTAGETSPGIGIHINIIWSMCSTYGKGANFWRR